MPDYIKSPMNYTGGKYKILEHIIPSFPKSINNFVDLFAGGLNVGINVQADTIYANDQITYLVDLYKLFQDTPDDSLAEGYNALRAEYNQSKSLLDLFVLTCYSFNHQIRFNSKHEFNTPFGKERSSFNESIERNLVLFCTALQKKNIILSTGDFRDFDFARLTKGDVVYCDPPYLITTGSYNDGKRGFKDWTESEDSDLLALLDKLNERGILFVKGSYGIKVIILNTITIVVEILVVDIPACDREIPESVRAPFSQGVLVLYPTDNSVGIARLVLS